MGQQIDRFASDKNRKSKRFNSRYLRPETEGVNAFSLDWSNEFNLLVPPVYFISKTIHHFLATSSEARAVLVRFRQDFGPYYTRKSTSSTNLLTITSH